ncbi:MAG: DNA (cytosine-5-)-methyltransferase [Moheibacter sp.]
MNNKLNYIDLFAGAGGLSEGFITAGFNPIAHVELEKAACNTLKTRAAYHFLKSKNRIEEYYKYLKNEISRDELYKLIPKNISESIINLPISDENNFLIKQKIDRLLDKRKVDLIVGGPPCQAYSLVGRSRSKTKMKGDPRNYLFIQYGKFLEIYKPKVFVFENVIGLLSANKGKYLDDMKALFLTKGYDVRLYILEAKNFGVLQNRKRIIIVGWLKNLKITPPELEEFQIIHNYKVKDVLNDLPKIQAGEGIDKYQKYATKTSEYLKDFALRNGVNILTQHVARPHIERDKEIYQIAVNKWNINKERLNYNDLPDKLKTHSNRNSFTDRFKIVAGDLSYSQTVVAHIAKDGHYYIHPDINQNRSLTVREAARLQSFPDDYFFEGEKEGSNRTAAFKQIGNAVPPLMALEIAKSILTIL